MHTSDCGAVENMLVPYLADWSRVRITLNFFSRLGVRELQFFYITTCFFLSSILQLHTLSCPSLESCRYTQNHYVANATLAAAAALNAGMDLNSNTILPSNLATAIALNFTTEATLNAALTRTLTKRFQAGMFDPLESQVCAVGRSRPGCRFLCFGWKLRL